MITSTPKKLNVIKYSDWKCNHSQRSSFLCVRILNRYQNESYSNAIISQFLHRQTVEHFTQPSYGKTIYIYHLLLQKNLKVLRLINSRVNNITVLSVLVTNSRLSIIAISSTAYLNSKLSIYFKNEM